MMEERKKFKDTKLGKFLKEKAPKILNTVGDVLPEKGVLGIVKNMISSSEELTPEDKEMAFNHLMEAYALELQDKESARNREIEIAKLHKFDFLFYLTGIIGLIVFCFIVYAIVYLQIPDDNKDVWIHLIGISEGVVLSIFGYYFGSSIKRNVNN
jgi:hypothetical protein